MYRPFFIYTGNHSFPTETEEVKWDFLTSLGVLLGWGPWFACRCWWCLCMTRRKQIEIKMVFIVNVLCDHNLFTWTISDLVIIGCREKFPLEKNEIPRSFKVFCPLSFSYCRVNRDVFASSLPCLFQLSFLPVSQVLLGPICCAWSTLAADCFQKAFTKMFLDWDQKNVNGNEGNEVYVTDHLFPNFSVPHNIRRSDLDYPH